MVNRVVWDSEELEGTHIHRHRIVRAAITMCKGERDFHRCPKVWPKVKAAEHAQEVLEAIESLGL